MDAVSWVVAAVIVNINWDSETWCQFSIAFFQVEKFTKWLTHTNWWRNCAYASLLLTSFIFNYVALRSRFRNGMNSLLPQLRWLCYFCCCYVASVVSDSARPHRRQPTRLPRPWDSPGKSTGVRCHETVVNAHNCAFLGFIHPWGLQVVHLKHS